VLYFVVLHLMWYSCNNAEPGCHFPLEAVNPFYTRCSELALLGFFMNIPGACELIISNTT